MNMIGKTRWDDIRDFKKNLVFGIPHHNDLVTLDASNSRKQNRQDFLYIIWIHNSENPKRRSFPTNNIWVHILHSFPETSHQKCNFCWRCKTFEFWNFQLVGSILKENLKSRLRFSELSFFLRCRCNLVQSVLLLQQERSKKSKRPSVQKNPNVQKSPERPNTSKKIQTRPKILIWFFSSCSPPEESALATSTQFYMLTYHTIT